jgi:hypothetical protein
MSRATTAAALLLILPLAAGCSGAKHGAVSAAVTSGSTKSTDSSSTNDDTNDSTSDDSASDPSTPTATRTPKPKPKPFAGKTAGEIWQQATKAAERAETVHIVARIKDGKQLQFLDLQISHHKAIGTISINSGKVEIRRIGSTIYLKGNAKYWRDSGGDAATAKLLTKNWIKPSLKDKDIRGLADFTDMNKFIDESLILSKSDRKELRRIPGITIRGHSTVGLADYEPGEITADSGIAYIQATGPARLLEMRFKKDPRQYIKFEDWNQSFTVPVPKHPLAV